MVCHRTWLTMGKWDYHIGMHNHPLHPLHGIMSGIRIGYTRKWLDLGGWQYSCLWKIGWYHSQKKTLKLIGIGHPSTWFQLVDQCWLGVIQFADPKRWWFNAVLTLPNHQLMNDRRLVLRHSKIRAQDRHFFEICLARCSHHSRILPGNLLFPPKYVVFTEVRVKFMWKKNMAQTPACGTATQYPWGYHPQVPESSSLPCQRFQV